MATGPVTINLEDYSNREDEVIRGMPKAEERLFHLGQKPAWVGGT